MNKGPSPETIQKMNKARKLYSVDKMPIKLAVKRAGISLFYYYEFPKKYPDIKLDHEADGRRSGGISWDYI